MRKPRNKLSALEIPWYFTISFNLFADKKTRTLNIKLSNADSREHTHTHRCAKRKNGSQLIRKKNRIVCGLDGGRFRNKLVNTTIYFHDYVKQASHRHTKHHFIWNMFGSAVFLHEIEHDSAKTRVFDHTSRFNAF